MNTVISTIDAATARAVAVRPKEGGFPYLAEALREAGVIRYYVDVPSCTVLYATAGGDVGVSHDPQSVPRQSHTAS